MTVTAADIVNYLEDEGQLVLLTGTSLDHAESVPVSGVRTHLTAGDGDIAWTRHSAATQFSGALLLAGEADPEHGGGSAKTPPDNAGPIAVCLNPRLAMALVVQHFFAHLSADQEPAYADPRVASLVARNHAWVKNAAVGHDVVIGPQATVGCSGMGFERNPQGRLVRFPQLGGVIVGDDVDIAAHATVQRGSIGDTILRRGAKIGPHVNVGHNVDVGEDVLIAGHAQIGGSARIGEGAVIWQGATIANGVTVGQGATVGMSAAVRKNVGAGEVWVGNPACRIR
jgi:acetyltransferase-like isoleucine patch superfamily enzyme